MSVDSRDRGLRLLRFTTLVALVTSAGCVSAPGRARVDDVALRSGVSASLSKDADLARLAKVDVDPSTGVVTLSGSVPTQADREKAGRLACAVKGVGVVYNDLEVRRAKR